MKRIGQLSREQKTRMISFGVLVIVMYVLVLLFGAELYRYIEFDGGDDVAKSRVLQSLGLFLFLTYGMVIMVLEMFMYGGMALVGLVLMGIWRLTAIRKDTEITEDEYYISKLILIAFAVITLITGSIVLHFRHVYFMVMIDIIGSALIYLLGTMQLKKRFQRCRAQQQEFMEMNQ